MSSPAFPPPPAGYQLDQPAGTSNSGFPPPPPGYQLDHPPLPPGYRLDQPNSAFATTGTSGQTSGSYSRGGQQAAPTAQAQPQKSIWGQLLDLRDAINDAETRMAKGAAEDLWGVAQGLGSLVKPPEFMLHPIAQRPKTLGQAVSQGAQAGAYATGLTTVGRAAKGYYDATRQNIQRAEQAADRGDTTGVWINSAAAGLPLVGPLIGGLYEDAQTNDLPTMAGKGISRIGQAMSMAPEGSVIPNPVTTATNGVVGAISRAGDDTGVSAGTAESERAPVADSTEPQRGADWRTKGSKANGRCRPG